MAWPATPTRWAEAGRPTVPVGARSRYRSGVERLAACQKPARGAPLYSQYVNRPLGRRLAAAADVVGLTPDTVSWASFALSCSGIAVVAVAPPSTTSGLVTAMLLALAYAVDSADGQLARLRGGGTLRGEWLDHVLDVAKISGLHLAVLVSFLRFDRGLGGVAVATAVFFELVAVVSFFTLILTEQLRRRSAAPPPDRAAFHGWRRVLSLPTDWGVHCWWFVTWGAGGWFVAGYGALALAGAAHLVVSNVARYRELGAAGGSS